MLADGWIGAWGYEARAEGLGEDCAVVVAGDGDFVVVFGADRGPVLECPLGVDGAGRPGDGVDLS